MNANVNLDSENEKKWDLVIQPRAKFFDLKINEIIKYWDLVTMFIKRDIVTVYKQTILGPLWFVIQPILTTLMFTVIFGRVANISTEGVPHVLFYLSGITMWNYFAECLRLTSDVFKKNESIFGKVYFPRIVIPLSIVISNLIKFSIQFVLFLVVYIYFIWQGANVMVNSNIILLPFLIAIVGVLSLGFGLMISSITSKYRDLTFLIQFGIQLFMYATPIVYPASIVGEQQRIFLWLNPMTSIVESFRYMFTGSGQFDWFWLSYSAFFALTLFLFGQLVFNKTERNFMDTI